MLLPFCFASHLYVEHMFHENTSSSSAHRNTGTQCKSHTFSLHFWPKWTFNFSDHMSVRAAITNRQVIWFPGLIIILQRWSFQRGLDKGEDKVEPHWKVAVAASSVIHPRIPSREFQTARWKWAVDPTALELCSVSPLPIFPKGTHLTL